MAMELGEIQRQYVTEVPSGILYDLTLAFISMLKIWSVFWAACVGGE